MLSFYRGQFVPSHPILSFYKGLMESLLFWEVSTSSTNISLNCLSLRGIIFWSLWFLPTRFKMRYYVTSYSKHLAQYLKEGRTLWDDFSCCSSIFNVHTNQPGADLGLDLSCYISRMLPRDLGAAGLGITLREAQPQSPLSLASPYTWVTSKLLKYCCLVFTHRDSNFTDVGCTLGNGHFCC